MVCCHEGDKTLDVMSVNRVDELFSYVLCSHRCERCARLALTRQISATRHCEVKSVHQQSAGLPEGIGYALLSFPRSQPKRIMSFRSLDTTPVLRRVDLCGELRREARIFFGPVGFPALASVV